MTKTGKFAVAAIVLGIAGGAVVAQTPGFTRTPLQTQPISASTTYHVVQARAEFQPGVAAGRHTHPGEEFGYVIEGALLLEVDGQPPRTVKAGEAFYVPAGAIHDGKNVGAVVGKVLATYVVEKGKPVATPVK